MGAFAPANLQDVVTALKQATASRKKSGISAAVLLQLAPIINILQPGILPMA